MYGWPGVGSGAWSTETEETYRPLKGFGNYGLLPVGNEYADKHWEKEKKEIIRDLRKLRENAVAASKKAGDITKEVYEWTGPWGASTLGSAMALLYVCHEHPGDVYGWLKGPLLTSLLGSLTKLAMRAEKKMKSYIQEKKERGYNVQREELRKGYFNFRKEMKKAFENRGGLDEEINAKYVIGVDRFTRMLGKKENPEVMRKELDKIKENLKRYLDTLTEKPDYTPDRKFGEPDDFGYWDALSMVA